MMKKTVSTVCAVAVLASGCAAPNGGSGDTGMSTESIIRCAALGTGGALVGGILGGTKGAIGGAVAGLAACAVIEYSSRQTKTASEVDREYKAANRNRLPPAAKIDSYSTVVTPNAPVKAGDTIKVNSAIRAVSGAQEQVTEVKEVLVAYAPSGDEFKRGEKIVSSTPGSGEYDNSFSLRLPQGAPQGIYKIKTQVFLNGKPGATRESSVQFARVNSQPGLVMVVAASTTADAGVNAQ